MTAIVNEVTQQAVANDSAATGIVALGAILLLISVLTFKEVLRAMGHAHNQRWMNALDVVIYPFLFIFVLTIVTRFLDLL